MSQLGTLETRISRYENKMQASAWDLWKGRFMSRGKKAISTWYLSLESTDWSIMNYSERNLIHAGTSVKKMHNANRNSIDSAIDLLYSASVLICRQIGNGIGTPEKRPKERSDISNPSKLFKPPLLLQPTID